ncbi:hypothetical protein PISL3812_04073 [Talaromyces islandicus]|uniref:Oxidoreductase DltE n=1 Tax=Talaromyces islandicus TaxID=28573 RepID=A0A0U1LUH3_TALIS|nr:hypothetical protein PISL3812_04073 [Talaromyces islandicus]
MALVYKKVLVIGATSGIGREIARKVVEAGSSVIIVGRRKKNLDEFVNQYGGDKVKAKVFDVIQLKQLSLEIPQFVSEVISEHPDIDCVFINSGIQRPFNFTQSETVDLDIFDQELVTNYTAPVYLTKAFLPHLQKQKSQGPTALVYTTSQLALIPTTRAPNYGASKAALHHFILALRSQLSTVNGPKVVELFPPAVQTELHDTKHQPDLKDGHLMGMPLDEYINETWSMFVQGEEQVVVAASQGIFDAFELKRQEIFHQRNEQAGRFMKRFLRE